MNNDLISREALKKALNEMFDTVEVVLFDDIIATIDNAPTVSDREVVEETEKACKTCDYYVNKYGYGQCYGQKNAPRVDDNEVCESWKKAVRNDT